MSKRSAKAAHRAIMRRHQRALFALEREGTVSDLGIGGWWLIFLCAWAILKQMI